MFDRDRLMAQLTTRDALLDTVRGLREELERVAAEAGEAGLEEPGAFGDLTLKDVIAHLTGWRVVTAARLEAALHHEEPRFPWPAGLSEENGDDLDAINHWFYETSRDKPVAAVLAESRATFDRVERALALVPDDDLFLAGRFPWLGDYTLGPGVISGTSGHYYEDHAPEIAAWLAGR